MESAALRELLLTAWEKVREKVLGNAAEPERRLSRRRSVTFTRPPRAWCLAVRASDRRINPAVAVMVPEHAADPHDADHPGRVLPHEVTIDSELLRRLCGPVRIARPGEMHDEVAGKLGVTPAGLLISRINGRFDTHYVKGLAGRKGTQVAVLYSEEELDPSHAEFEVADSFWGWTGRGRVNEIPDCIEQTLERVPHYRAAVSRHRYADHAHPEAAELADPVPRPRRRLPPVPPDYVWYKWKGDQYVGDAVSRRMEEMRRKRRESERRYRREHPRPSKAGGSICFDGWRWICPGCGREVRTIYYPTARFEMDQLLPAEVQARINSAEASFRPADCFACQACHRVQFFSRVRPGSWNEIVSYLSGGLLYGSEVPMPPEFPTVRKKRRYRPSATRAPSKRREEVLERLMEEMPYRQIAKELGIAKQTVAGHAHNIYRQHGVHGAAELAKVLGRKLPGRKERMCEEVERRLLAGETKPQIAAGMNLSIEQVMHRVRCVYKAHGVSSREELAEKLGMGDSIERC